MTEIEDGSFGPSVDVFLTHLRRALAEPGLSIPGRSPGDLQSLQTFLDPVFSHAVRTAGAVMAGGPPSNDALLAEVSAIRHALSTQAPGTAVGLPCGWRTAKSGHTLFLTIERPLSAATDVRDVYVSNSGPGLQYHPADHGSQYPTTRYQATLALPGVPVERLVDEWVLYLLLQNFGTRKDTNTAQVR